MEHNERFDALWAGLKEQVRKAREAKKGEPMRLDKVDSAWHGKDRDVRLYIGASPTTASVSVCGIAFEASAWLNKDELIQHAAHCIAAAQDIADAQRLPHEIAEQEADDEQKPKSA